jgi:hypothetical protein
MSSEAYPRLDGNAVAGELNRIFAFDTTTCGREVYQLWSKEAFCGSSLVRKMSGTCGDAAPTADMCCFVS